MEISPPHVLGPWEVFDGQKSFDEWVSHFENVSAVNGWNDDDKLQSGSPEKHTWHLLN